MINEEAKKAIHNNSKKSWLGFLKIWSIAVALMSGILGIALQVIFLYSDNPDITWQKRFFWLFVWISFFISSIATWLIEHKKVKDLEKKIETLYAKLDIEIKDIFLSMPPKFEDFNSFITIVLSIT